MYIRKYTYILIYVCTPIQIYICILIPTQQQQSHPATHPRRHSQLSSRYRIVSKCIFTYLCIYTYPFTSAAPACGNLRL